MLTHSPNCISLIGLEICTSCRSPNSSSSSTRSDTRLRLSAGLCAPAKKRVARRANPRAPARTRTRRPQSQCRACNRGDTVALAAAAAAGCSRRSVSRPRRQRTREPRDSNNCRSRGELLVPAACGRSLAMHSATHPAKLALQCVPRGCSKRTAIGGSCLSTRSRRRTSAFNASRATLVRLRPEAERTRVALGKHCLLTVHCSLMRGALHTIANAGGTALTAASPPL